MDISGKGDVISGLYDRSKQHRKCSSDMNHQYWIVGSSVNYNLYIIYSILYTVYDIL